MIPDYTDDDQPDQTAWQHAVANAESDSATSGTPALDRWNTARAHDRAWIRHIQAQLTDGLPPADHIEENP